MGGLIGKWAGPKNNKIASVEFSSEGIDATSWPSALNGEIDVDR